MPIEPTPFDAEAEPLVHDVSGAIWRPILRHDCTFTPDNFDVVMVNLVKNPNLNTKWLFRADILHDSEAEAPGPNEAQALPAQFKDFFLERSLVRRLVPRNTNRDNPLDQTCLFFRSLDGSITRSLVVYLPHESSSEQLPFYHPKVRGVAQLHEWDETSDQGTISVHYWLFEDADFHVDKLQRTALMLLTILHKHGQGTLAGYVKQVHHDLVVPQAIFQDRYTALKLEYAKPVIDSWAEVTDPEKHVFEDLGIAAFLIELWAVMYKDKPFPGFVDIGCGNGLLVYLLRKEGYSGWGFDARSRRSWESYTEMDPSLGSSLQKRVLLPTLVTRSVGADAEDPEGESVLFHDGIFPKGTFIISNHADELTPWTPILATQSESPFISIPCCSHDLGGARYRAPPPRDKTKSSSAYASLVDWVARIAEDCGWMMETEALRIPSTRNIGLLGRTRTTPAEDIDLDAVVAKYGGTANYYENAVKLTSIEPKGH
jgi:tRNASer (uridine44-2'-O)-methyltransferase